MNSQDDLFAGDDVDMVRLKLNTGGYNTEWLAEAREWLAQKDRLSRSKIEASQSEQMRIARTAKTAAIIAAIAAAAAIPLAIIGIAISWLAYSK